MAIRPTFYGFEMARSALTASQKNIDVTGQNIANINTTGYSRQRVDLSSVGAGGINWKYTLLPSDNIGLGVNVDGINRMRDQFLDVRFWKENSDNGRYALKSDTLNSLSNLLDEFTIENVHHILGEFNDALQEYNKNADQVEFSNNTKMVAETLMRALNKISGDISVIHKNQIQQLNLRKDDINYTAKCMDDINTEIRNQQLLGPVSNELLDQRDLLIDKLSQYGNVLTRLEEDGGTTVFFGDGDEFLTVLVDGKQEDYIPETNGYYNILSFDTEHDPANGPYRLTWASGNNVNGDVNFHTGEIFGLYEMLNGMGDVTMAGNDLDQATKGIPFFNNILNNFAQLFADEFNTINGSTLFDSMDGSEITAENIKISDAWRDNPLEILRSTTITTNPNEAANDNIFRFINSLNNKIYDFPDGYKGTFTDYIGSLNSEIAIEENYNNKQLSMSDGLLISIANLRESIMSVSEDEEAMNLVKFQKSYNAAARFMTTLDEMLDRIINNLGIVGR